MLDLRHGDCLEVLRGMEADSVDAVVTDPPYGLSFMGKGWDYEVPTEDVWRECLRVLKPGGHLLAFAGTRTQHRMAVRIEDAGFEIRDMIAWVYGSGFPKSMDVSKAIDKAAGVTGTYGDPKSAAHAGWIDRGKMRGGEGHEGYQRPWMANPSAVSNAARKYEGASDAARQWDGWGTALKPALEPITVARKPLVGTVAANVLQHGTGAINVDGCRVPTEEAIPVMKSTGGRKFEQTHTQPDRRNQQVGVQTQGRWPANLIHDGSDEVVGLFPQTTSGSRKAGRHVVAGGQGRYGEFAEGDLPEVIGDSGSAARFFYCAKASKADRDEGCEGLEERGRSEVYGTGMNAATKCDLANGHTPESVEARPLRRNIHPTVKPTALMRYLCRLVTPPNGIVLDPFMGSGSTGKAAILEGFRFVGIEREADYIEIARARIEAASREAGLFGDA